MGSTGHCAIRQTTKRAVGTMSGNFIHSDRDAVFLVPPSIQDWLPEGHLASHVVDIVGSLDLSALTGACSGTGRRAYNPEMLLSLLIYGYATGVHSSRKLELATWESVPFRCIAANTHPDHDTIAAFRKRFLPELQDLFLQVLLIAGQAGLVKLDRTSLDGAKVRAKRQSAQGTE